MHVICNIYNYYFVRECYSYYHLWYSWKVKISLETSNSVQRHTLECTCTLHIVQYSCLSVKLHVHIQSILQRYSQKPVNLHKQCVVVNTS